MVPSLNRATPRRDDSRDEWPRQRATGVKLLWGTANVFSNRRYMNGAATNPDFLAAAHAGVQIKNAIDATIALGAPTMSSGVAAKAI